jgi:type IV secretion system protein VirD4
MKTKPKSNVQFVLDEFPAVGHMESIDQAIGIGRGYGIRLLLVVQSLSQARKNSPDGQELTLISNTSQIFFGVNDMATAAEMVSNRLGERTIVLESGGANRGTSHSHTSGGHPQNTAGNSGGSSTNWSQRERKLLKPEEVLALPPRTAITFTPGVPPIRTTLVRYYEEPRLFDRSGWLARQGRVLWLLCMSAVLCAVMLCGAVMLTGIVETTLRRHVPAQPIPIHVDDEGVSHV